MAKTNFSPDGNGRKLSLDKRIHPFETKARSYLSVITIGLKKLESEWGSKREFAKLCGVSPKNITNYSYYDPKTANPDFIKTAQILMGLLGRSPFDFESEPLGEDFISFREAMAVCPDLIEKLVKVSASRHLIHKDYLENIEFALNKALARIEEKKGNRSKGGESDPWWRPKGAQGHNSRE